jgi:WD40 repeat protein
MQLVDVKGSKLTRSPLCNYVISEGKVTGFALHPSGDYLLVTSSKGRIYVFRIDTGELRGTIRIPLNASGCETDPSGLYVIVKVPAFSNHNAQSLAQGGQGDFGHFVANERDLSRNTVLMYEIGTGLPAAEVCSVFEVTQMKFSSDGRYLSLGSSSGAISVWSTGSHLLSNVKQVLDAMSLSGDFWFNYPIFLPDYEQFHSMNPEPLSV